MSVVPGGACDSTGRSCILPARLPRGEIAGVGGWLMLLDVLLLAGGAVLLAYAGNRLVDFAVAVAEKARLTPAVIGLTIVAAGTSAPELLVSVTGALRGSPGIAMGNVVGPNGGNNR